MLRLARWAGGFGLGLLMGLSLGAILGWLTFLGLMCAPYSGCRAPLP